MKVGMSLPWCRRTEKAFIEVFPPLPIEPVRVYQALTHWPGYSSTRL
ncbi:hypothetical protein SAMN05216217_102147 [Halopseudomonas yangmingensis]|uniref:Uncharacterized protein n=1 Tax=Halopseudomonas yangmingensis TaxID=1720063 RepID=A0A1I4P6W9_9GAMM|nr:hypothetical protein SAMN05216217_102147 [Halopseudomonas yangmingensis]